MRDVGDRINIRHEVRDASGTLTNATVAVAVTKPDGTTVTPAPTVTNTSTGIYDAAFTVDATGKWTWVWSVSGAIVDKAYGEVDVADPGPSTYATLPQLRERVLGDGSTQSDRDPRLQSALNAAARDVDSDTGRRPGGFQLDSAVSQRIYRVSGRVLPTCDGWKLLVDEIGSSTGLVVETGDGTTWTAVTDYQTDPENALADRRPITGLIRTLGTWGWDRVRVTARWGWPRIPDQVAEATLIRAHRLYRRPGSPEGVAGGSNEFGGIRLARTDPDYERLISKLLLPGVA